MTVESSETSETEDQRDEQILQTTSQTVAGERVRSECAHQSCDGRDVHVRKDGVDGAEKPDLQDVREMPALKRRPVDTQSAIRPTADRVAGQDDRAKNVRRYE